ncbi:MAG: DUF1571 domain-containing protein [Bacteroidales bacterium]|nr:DUF1571 domain-containing protein [Bacteroidales bacterium]
MAQKNAVEIIEAMLHAQSKVSTLKVTMYLNERIKGEILKKKGFFKINYNPKQVYLKMEYPNNGMEILYSHGQRDNKAIIYPNGFPWINITLDPYSRTMREEHHHAILNSGFEYFGHVVEHLINKHQEALNQCTRYEGIVSFGSIRCHKISFNSPGFALEKYTAQPGENIVAIANRFFVNEYMLLERNPKIANGYEEDLNGMEIMVPTDYGQEVVIYVQTDTNLPYGIKVFDEKGLFEEYYFTNTEVNVKFEADEFTTAYKEYNF